MRKETGGTAFPFVSHGGCHEHQYCDPGMELRDYFAAKAMQGIVGHDDAWGITSLDGIAEKSYELADAMMAARNT